MTASDEKGQETLPGLPSRRAVIAGAVWTTPAVMLLTATPAFAASPGTIPSLKFTSYGGNAQYGPNWGTKGQVQFYVTGENVSSQNPTAKTANVTITLHYAGPGTPVPVEVIHATVPSGGTWNDNQIYWIVPGYQPNSNNLFYFEATAPGFVTVRTPNFTINMP
jgi:hypothetical protein